MCQCKLDIEKKLSDSYRSDAPANERNHTAEITSYTFAMSGIESDTITMKPKLDVRIVYDRTNKQGVSVRKTAKSVMLANYCPFCGEKIQSW